MKKILLTFDLEEFDSLFVFDYPENEEDIFNISKSGLDELLGLLKKYSISATFFTTLKFARKYPLLIKELSKEHEIACHGYNHSDSYKKDLSRINLAKIGIEKIISKEIKGFRAPRFEIKDIPSLSKFNFKYDSSVHPTFIPGRYFNIFKKRKVHKTGEISEIPPSVLPFLRLPIFWLAFKNMPIFYSNVFTKLNFLFSEYTMLIFHPWEFADLKKIKMPNYMKKKNGKALIDMLEKYILFCRKKNYSFETISNYLGL